MSDDRKRNEFWNYLVAEKNQPRPKGITMQRLAVIKPVVLQSDQLWSQVIGRHGAADRAASEFYQSDEPSAALSRTAFWDAVRLVIRQNENAATPGNPRLQPNTKPITKSRSRGRRKPS